MNHRYYLLLGVISIAILTLSMAHPSEAIPPNISKIVKPVNSPKIATKPLYHPNKALSFNMIAIEYSESCIKMIKVNITSHCPNIQTLMKYDTSNQNISGHFTNKTGTWIREKPEVKEHYKFYQYYSKPVVCVDCAFPGSLPDVMKLIIIEPGNFTWASVIEADRTGKLTEHKNLYVSENCLLASISNIKQLNQTIAYMKNNCKGTLDMNTSIIKTKDTPIYQNGTFITYKHWLDDIGKSFKNQDCRYVKCIAKDPHSNPEYNKTK